MTDIQASELILNGVEYVRKDSVNKDRILAMSKDNMVIIRCRNAGVHAGVILSFDNINGLVEISNSRRLWKWVSKATLSELAIHGPVSPRENKYGCVVPVLSLNKDDLCEIILCTEEAAKLIEAVPVWSAK
jgi:hypothetical protein